MRARIAAWLDAHANPEWRQFWQLHSARVTFFAGIFWSVLAGIWVALPAFIDWFPPPVFMGISIAFSFAIMIARFTKQPGLPDV
jgi:hypothetical protein